jgi:hypothetical protein
MVNDRTCLAQYVEQYLREEKEEEETTEKTIKIEHQ